MDELSRFEILEQRMMGVSKPPCYICSILKSPQPHRPPKLQRSQSLVICQSCKLGLGIESLLGFINKLQNDEGDGESTNNSPVSWQMKGFQDVGSWVKDTYKKMKEFEELKDYLHDSVDACREQTKYDIKVKPSNDGPSISTHRALLATRSEIFKDMLLECKARADDTITFPELNYEELECLIEFLYHGSLPVEKMEKHVYSLSNAAHKYEISYLQKAYEHQMRTSLNTSNALVFLEISDSFFDEAFKETILEFIAENYEDVIFANNYYEFVVKKPHLSIDITRACYLHNKRRRR